jgi:hypothetical protein
MLNTTLTTVSEKPKIPQYRYERGWEKLEEIDGDAKGLS